MKRRKSGILAFALCAMIFLFPVFASGATHATELPEDMNQAYIIEKAVDFTNKHFSEELSRLVTKDDVDLSAAYKIYVDTDIFSLETNSFREVLDKLEEGAYIFELPLYIGKDTYIVNISQVLPVPETDYATMADPEGYRAKVGTWDIPGVGGYFPPETVFEDYYKIARDVSGITDRTPLLVGSLPCFTRAVALYPDDNGNINKLVTLSPYNVNWEALGLEPQEHNVVLDYAEIKKIVNALPKNVPDDEVGGSGAGFDQRQAPPADSGHLAKGIFVALAIMGVPAVVYAVFAIRRRVMKRGA